MYAMAYYCLQTGPGPSYPTYIAMHNNQGGKANIT
jgi:hypothetical protein